MVTPIIPLNTAVPRDWRISAPAPCAIASGNTPRMNAKDVIKIGRRRIPRGRGGGFRCFLTLVALPLLGELHDQDRVLGGQPQEHHKCDLSEDVDRHGAHIQARGRGQEAHRHDQDDRQRQPPALIVSGQHEEDEEGRSRKDQRGRDSLLFLLMAEFRPFDGETLRQHFLRNLFHPLHGCARGNIRSSATENVGSGIKVVTRLAIRLGVFMKVRHRANGHHFAAGITNLETADVLWRLAELLSAWASTS